MISVYAIKSLKYKFRYVSIAKDLGDRLLRHNSGRSKSTKPYAPYELILREEYADYEKARVREKFLKSGVGRKFLDDLENNSV